MDPITNEQTKLTASWLSTLAAAVIVVGSITPVVALAYGLAGSPKATALSLALSGAGAAYI